MQLGRMYRTSDLPGLTALSVRRIYELKAAGLFPEPIRISARRVAWREADIAAWLDERARRGNANEPSSPDSMP